MPSSPKTAFKTARSPVNGAEIPLGAHPGNTGGKKGKSGRKPDWLKQFCEEVLSSKETMEAAKAILKDKDHGAFTAMWKAAADRAVGKAKESVDVTLSGELTIKQEWSFGTRKVGF